MNKFKLGIENSAIFVAVFVQVKLQMNECKGTSCEYKRKKVIQLGTAKTINQVDL